VMDNVLSLANLAIEEEGVDGALGYVTDFNSSFSWNCGSGISWNC